MNVDSSKHVIWPMNLKELDLDEAGARSINDEINKNLPLCKNQDIKIVAHVLINGSWEDRKVTLYKGGDSIIVDFGKNGLYDVIRGKKIEPKFPENKDALWRDLGISIEEAGLLRKFIESKYLDDKGTGKTYKDTQLPDGKWLPRPVTFHEDGKVTIELLGGEKGCTFIPGDLYDPIAQEKLSKNALKSIEKPSAKESSSISVKESGNGSVNFSKNVDDLYNKMGILSNTATLLKTSIEQNYSKYQNSGKTFKEDQLSVTKDWLPPVTFLKNGEVIIELENDHLKGQNLVYEALSGKRYKTEEMSEDAWIKYNEKSRSMELLDRPVFHYKMVGKDGKEIVRVLFNDELTKSVEASTFEVTKGSWNEVALPHQYLYGVKGDSQEKRGPPYHLSLPKEEARWTNINTVGESEIGPKKTFSIDPQTQKTVIKTEGMKTFDRTTSVVFKSDYITNVSGIEFKGSIKNPEGKGEYLNHFAIFFHTDKFYDGGYEYGWAFREGTNVGQFYIEGDANVYDVVLEDGRAGKNTNHIWNDWPKINESGGGFTVADEGVEDLLKDLDKERTLSIHVLKNGDFHLQIEDPETGQTKICIVKKPDKFPNLHGAAGYFTINAQKFKPNEVTSPGEFNVKEVKMWKSDI